MSVQRKKILTVLAVIALLIVPAAHAQPVPEAKPSRNVGASATQQPDTKPADAQKNAQTEEQPAAEAVKAQNFVGPPRIMQHVPPGQPDFCPALTRPETYKSENAEDFSMIVFGKDNWAYRTRFDFKFRFLLTDATTDYFSRLQQALKANGTDLVVVMMPARGIAAHEFLVGPYNTDYDYRIALKNYLEMLDELRAAGIYVPDMTGVENVSNYFLQRDNHWTAIGAEFTALRTADMIKSIPAYRALKKENFKTVKGSGVVDSSDRYGEFITSICGVTIPAQKIPAPDVTTPVQEGSVSSNALFGDDSKPEIALVGTSNSTNPEPSLTNFEGKLEQELKADILNRAISGGSLQSSITSFLVSGDYKAIKPKILVWEMSSHYGFNQQDFFREIVPAVYGVCESPIATNSMKVDGKSTPTVLDNLSDKNIAGNRYYAAVQLSDKSQRMVKVRFVHKDGRTDTVKLERSTRDFSSPTGLFFAELNDTMVAPLEQVMLGLQNPKGTARIDICAAPEPDLKQITDSRNAAMGFSGKKVKKRLEGLTGSLSDMRVFGSHYTVQASDENPAMPVPKLPRLDGYTRTALLAKIPPLKAGNMSIGPMEGAAPIRKFAFDKRLVEFQKIQNRVQPQAIHIHSGVHDFMELVRNYSGSGLIVDKGDAYVMRIPVAIYPNAKLIIRGLSKPLLMSQDRGAFIAAAGDLFIVDSKLLGWDEKNNKPAELNAKRTNFRPFITMWDGTHLYMENSHLGYMGYALSKSYGLTVSTSEVIQEVFGPASGELPQPTGWILNSTFDHMYFGFYSYEADGFVIMRNTYTNNVIYGIDPHDRSRNLIIAYNRVSGSKKKHGIIISREVNDSYIIYNDSFSNRGSGIMLDRESINNVVAYNLITYNKGDGITLYESPHNMLYGNVIENNRGSGIRVRNSWDVTAVGGSISMNNGYAFELYQDDLKHTSRDFDLDPVTERAAAVFGHMGLESNGGLLKTDKFESVQFVGMDLRNQFLGKRPLAGDVTKQTKKFGYYVKDTPSTLGIVQKGQKININQPDNQQKPQQGH